MENSITVVSQYGHGWNTYTAKSLRSSFLNLQYAGQIANVGLKLQKLVPYISKNHPISLMITMIMMILRITMTVMMMYGFSRV